MARFKFPWSRSRGHAAIKTRREAVKVFQGLGVAVDALDATALKKAYRRLAVQHHPDIPANHDRKAASLRTMQDLNGAYDILKDGGREYIPNDWEWAEGHPEPFQDPFGRPQADARYGRVFYCGAEHAPRAGRAPTSQQVGNLFGLGPTWMIYIPPDLMGAVVGLFEGLTPSAENIQNLEEWMLDEGIPWFIDGVKQNGRMHRGMAMGGPGRMRRLAEPQRRLGRGNEVDEFPQDNEPQEDDLITYDYLTFFQHGKQVLQLTTSVRTREDGRFGSTKRFAEAGELSNAAMWKQINAWMKSQGYFPNVWWISDHGNAHLMSPSKPIGRPGHANRVGSGRRLANTIPFYKRTLDSFSDAAITAVRKGRDSDLWYAVQTPVELGRANRELDAELAMLQDLRNWQKTSGSAGSGHYRFATKFLRYAIDPDFSERWSADDQRVILTVRGYTAVLMLQPKKNHAAGSVLSHHNERSEFIGERGEVRPVGPLPRFKNARTALAAVVHHYKREVLGKE